MLFMYHDLYKNQIRGVCMPPPLRPLYAMAKFSSEEQAKIMALSRASHARPSELLHITLLAFVDLADFPPEFVSVLLATLSGFEPIRSTLFSIPSWSATQ
jgi:hypothetical protein